MTSNNNLNVEKNKAEVSKNVPELRFQGFIDAWEQRKLSDLMTFSNGINAPKENYGTGTKMISVMDILNPLPIKYDNILNSVAVDKKIEDKNKVEKGDLIFVRSSEIVEEVGWAKAYKEDRYALYSGFAIRGKRISSYNAYFIELTLNYANRKEVERRAGGSTRFNVSQEILNSLTVLTPLISEQNQIDLFFTKIDNTIALHQRKLEKLKRLKQGYLQQLFPKNDEEVPSIRFAYFENKWEQRKLGDLLTKNSKKNKDLNVTNVESVSNKTGFTKQTEQFEDYSVASADLSNYYVITEKQFAYNPSRINVGSIAYKAVGDDKSVVSPLYVSFSTKKLLNDGYLWNWFKTTSFQSQRERLSEGGVRDTLSFNQLSEMLINVPEYLEQEKIGSFFKQMDDAIALYLSKLDKLKSIKQSLLQKMFI
ncbi:restriction endonuclease subunit S [Lactococcus cremoris]|uniref:restriction endonuclease subunit S n=1 Tax=Lactococcus lactis subsp. cremoris TaxID=1359 RepID=UPI002FC7B43D